MTIRLLTIDEYPVLKALYENSGWFDPETDSKRLIERQLKKNPNAILVAVENEQIIGSVTLLFTERLGLFFRLIADNVEVSSELLKKGEKIFRKEGYSEVHIIAPLEDGERQVKYEAYGFEQGKPYKWFWKKI